jgi:hypothetical protein
MKPMVQTANVEEETIPLKEVIPFWFAVSSPLPGMLLGLLGAWFVGLAQRLTTSGEVHTH